MLFYDAVNCWDYIGLVIDEQIDMKHWWNDTKREKLKYTEKTVPMPRDQLQILHGLAWDIADPYIYFWVFKIFCFSITLNTHTFSIQTYTKSHCLSRYCLIRNEHALQFLHTLKWHTVQEIMNYSNIKHK